MKCKLSYDDYNTLMDAFIINGWSTEFLQDTALFKDEFVINIKLYFDRENRKILVEVVEDF